MNEADIKTLRTASEARMNDVQQAIHRWEQQAAELNALIEKGKAEVAAIEKALAEEGES